MNPKTQKTFEGGKTISELGIDVTRKFVLINNDDEDEFEKGDVLEIVTDYKDEAPKFRRIKDGETAYLYLRDVYYLEEPKVSTKKFTQYFKRWDNIIFEEDVIDGVSVEEIKAKHKELGDKLRQHRKLFPNKKK